MRLTIVITLLTVVQLSAATTFGQRLTYNKKNTTVNQLFKEIKAQTGYHVVWHEGYLSSKTALNASFNNSPVEEVLTSALKGLPVTYQIIGKNIIIKPTELSLVDKVLAALASIEVKGRVVDENGQPLVGAVIRVKGTKQATSTNNQGEFVLNNVNETSVLVVSFVGYESEEIFASKNIGTITLKLKADKLHEVEINAGYYTVKERERTGAISKITNETINKQPINNPLMALQGRVAGLQITQNTGLPGGDFKVRIRGQNSIRSGNDPLYIIDGVNFPSTGIAGTGTNIALGSSGNVSPLSLISPTEIESIEILKDADATAIYGSRGANGVILITTKKGISGDTKIDARFSQGYSQVGRRVDLLNTEEYLAMRREAFKNDGLSISATDYDVNGTWDSNKYTDWQDLLIGGTASITNASVNIGGGNTKSNYLIAGNYYTEGTVLPGKFGFERFGVRSNINLGTAQDRFSVNLTTNFNRTENTVPGFAGQVMNIFMPPNTPDLYDQNGRLNWANNTLVTNPMADLLVTSNAITDNLVGNLILNYKIVNNLTFKTSLGYTSIKRQELWRNPLISKNPATNPQPTQRQSRFGTHYNTSWIAEPQINYNSKILNGRIDALVGMSLQNNDAKINVIQGANFTSDDLLENIGSAGTITNLQNDISQYRYFGVFGRLNYSLADKYFLNLTARRDGSTRFGPGKQFANFGAIGAAWIFSDEKLIKDFLPFLTFGKLRTSYGLTGNDQIANYGYLNLWNTSTNYEESSTLTPSTLAPNTDFSWETNRKFEVSLQLGFFDERINLGVSYFRNRSSNQLLLQNLPLSSGKVSVYRNLPAKIQNVGWEFESDLTILSSKVFKWSANINLTIPNNKLLTYPDLGTSVDANTFKIGMPLNITNRYNITVDTSTGLYSFEDKNASGTRDNKDLYLTTSLDQSYYGGLQNSFRYKQFNLDFHFVFAKQMGRRFYNTISPGFWFSGAGSNQLRSVLNRWQQPGDDSSLQRFSTTSANLTLHTTANSLGNTALMDASFLSLRNVSLAWSFPQKFISSLNLSNVSVNLQGQNLFILTDYAGLDPETQTITNIPPLRTITLGLNVTF